MTAVFGFGGVHANERRLSIAPRLYSRWKALEFNLAYRGDRFAVRITPASVTVTAATGNAGAHRLLLAGQNVKCAPGTTVAVKVRPAAAKPSRPKPRRRSATFSLSE